MTTDDRLGELYSLVDTPVEERGAILEEYQDENEERAEHLKRLREYSLLLRRNAEEKRPSYVIVE